MDRARWAGLAAVNAAALIFGSAALLGALHLSPAWIVAGRAGFAVAALAVLDAPRPGRPGQGVTLRQALPSGVLLGRPRAG